MARIQPLTGTDVFRQRVAMLGLIRAMEVHSTSDNFRLFLNNRHIGGPVIHGDVADEVTMLALTTEAERSVFPGDFCYRIDTATFWICWFNRGALLTDWREFAGGGGGGSSITEVDGGGASDEFTDILDGGDAGDEFDSIVDGDPDPGL